MPFIQIYVHAVWSTKNRDPLIAKEIRQEIFSHIKENAAIKNIVLDTIGGWYDHVHCLFSMDASQSIAGIMNLVKGEVSFWINKNKLTKIKFEWQDEYFAVSISPKDIDSVRRYIRNQESHHRKRTFQDEYDDFLVKAGFELVKG